MYTIQNFGYDLKQLLKKTNNIVEIANFCFQIMNYTRDTEDGVDDIACTLALMEEGEGFEYTIKELNEIADRLIAGDRIITQLGIDPKVKLRG